MDAQEAAHGVVVLRTVQASGRDPARVGFIGCERAVGKPVGPRGYLRFCIVGRLGSPAWRHLSRLEPFGDPLPQFGVLEQAIAGQEWLETQVRREERVVVTAHAVVGEQRSHMLGEGRVRRLALCGRLVRESS